MAPPSTFASQDIDPPSPDLRDVIRSEVRANISSHFCPSDRLQAFADTRLERETVDFGRPRTEIYTMGESGSKLSQGIFIILSPYPNRGRLQAPRGTSQSPARRPSRSPSSRSEEN
ncbi:hypothetical protein LAZ67_6003186 [Cordylochernes scorpioides]|uniref:Uncharacterized protein n=1 Tax=Cordylochernes scorpioides TaxID=51811 RepID=A0ABY6KKC4_9ARAC|nr:hypothetical protein LAZ67_6003186 [Cordylochernes scorpioides]